MLINEKLNKAESDLSRANSGNIIELCRDYLQTLTEYREDLYKLRGSPEINLQQPSALARELIEQFRKAVRTAVETATIKRHQTERLLRSFTAISGYEAVNTFNHLYYQGFDDWELRANSVYPRQRGIQEKITISEAVDAASLLRCEAYVTNKFLFFR